MNKISKYIAPAALLALSATAFTACDSDFETPPVYIPVSPIEANATILEVKQMFDQNTVNYATQVGLNNEGDSIVIHGRVISSDESGNIFKKFVIYDGTAAIPISINQKNLYQNYCYGQDVVINLTGIWVGKYAGLLQIGSSEPYQTGTQTSFLPEETAKKHFYPNGYAYPDLVEPLSVTLSELNALLDDKTTALSTMSRLVRINEVYWEDAGAPFSTAETTSNRLLCDKAGNTITVRNSGYSDFFWNILPGGYGSVEGILSQFNDTYQLELLSLNSLIGFDPNARPVGKALFTKATSVQSGSSYALVADSKVAKPVPGDKGYGWLYVADVTINDDKFDGATSSAFKFTANGEYYYIQQADDRYLSMDGTFNSFQVYADPQGDKSLWKVAANADGTFTITNKEMNKYVQFSPGFSSYGAYPSAQDGGMLPQLFLATE